jgi:hypothetical protein
MADGKPANRFAFNGRPRNKSFTMNILYETHWQWRDLMTVPGRQNFALECTHINARYPVDRF